MPNAERAALAGSLEQFGFLQPVIARGSDRLVIGGHQRIEAARQLGWTEVPVIWWEGSDQDARALNLALSRGLATGTARFPKAARKATRRSTLHHEVTAEAPVPPVVWPVAFGRSVDIYYAAPPASLASADQEGPQ